MEVLFSDSIASLEAYIVLLCVIGFVALYFYDGYDFLLRLFATLRGKSEKIEGTPIQSDNTRKTESHKEEETALPVEKNIEGIPAITIEVPETGQTIEVASPFLEDITPKEIEKHVSTREKEKEEEIAHIEEMEEKIQATQEKGEDALLEISEETHDAKNEEDIYQEEEIEETSVEYTEATLLRENEQKDEDTAGIDIHEEEQENIHRAEDVPEEKSQEKTEEYPQNTEEKKPEKAPLSTHNNNAEILFGLANQVRTAVARGQILEARGLIIQGLALEKNHRELNLILAEIYENDKQFEKAEYIYKDLAALHANDGEILEKLANVLIIQRRYDVAREIYKNLLTMTGETEGTLYILTHLSSELADHEQKYEYARRYQKQWPNNPEILTLLAQAEIALGKRRDAIETLKRLKNLTPYNNEILETIQKLVVEEELAGNFGN